MSTRSGRRIHSSFHENTVKAEAAPVPKSERKTRGKRQKENDVNLGVTVPRAGAATKRQNYVTYPADSNSTDDEHNNAHVELPPLKTAKKTRRNTLKELNADLPVSQDNHQSTELTKIPRLTRQMRKFVQNVIEQPTEAVNGHSDGVQENDLRNSGSKKSKKNKSKREKAKDNVSADELETETSPNEGAKKKKNKKGSKIARQTSEERNTGLQSSVESYYTAAGSPSNAVLGTEQDDDNDYDNLKTRHDQLNGTFDKTEKLDGTFEKTKKLNGTFDKTEKLDGTFEKNKKLNGTFDKTEKLDGTFEKTKKLNGTFDKTENLDGTFEKTTKLNGTFDKMEKLDETFEKTKNLNGTFDKPNVISIEPENTSINGSNKKQRSKRKLSSMQAVDVTDGDLKSSPMNTAIDNCDTANHDQLNTTFERSLKKRKSNANISNSSKTENTSVKLNGTFDKSPKPKSLDTTFDKTDTKPNSTFDKSDSKLNATFDKSASQKSSLVSSDRDSNVTFDKSDVSRISITSDEDSKTENIVNTTPLLIESSMDESKSSIDTSKRKSKSIDQSNIARTPLKRESTFTKESPESELDTTPPNASTSAPGSTPFYTSRSGSRVSHKDGSVLNVTRSIEKPSRSSTSEVCPSMTRQTRVMFCSPTNSRALESTMTRKVIKSSMKGSNKSFVFQDNERASSAVRPSALPAPAPEPPSAARAPAPEPPSAARAPAPEPPSAARAPAPAPVTAIPRKRSMTTSDADRDASRSKRSRLDANATLPRAATAQPRATVKLPTPNEPAATPRPRTRPRTALPDFAALHRRRFAKMESLDECQQRKAQRAQQLLTPVRRSLTDRAEQPKSPNAVKNSITPSVASSTIIAPNPYALDSLRPGFTRFGFKTNKTIKETPYTENNPFSGQSKTDVKVKENMSKLKDKNIHKTPFSTGKSVKKNNENTFTNPNKTMEKGKSKVKVAVAEAKNPQPSLTGTTAVRKERARQIVMRERDETSCKRERSRCEARVTIKGVRTNRRFELQMRMRDMQ